MLHLLPGEALVERRLETLLELSRTPIRSALVRLEREGLVRAIRRHGGRGFIVALLDLREIEQAYDFRLILKNKRVQLAARRDPTEGARLDVLLHNAQHIDEEESWLEAATDFHVSLARVAGNRFLTETLTGLLPRIKRARILQVMEERGRNLDEHRDIWARVRAGDADGARRLISQHIRSFKQSLLDALARQQRRLLARGAMVHT